MERATEEKTTRYFRFFAYGFRKAMCCECRCIVPKGEVELHARHHFMSGDGTGSTLRLSPAARAFKDVQISSFQTRSSLGSEWRHRIESTGWVTSDKGPG